MPINKDIAQFLLINSTALKSQYLDGKMASCCFFFHYARQEQKRHYTDFAFEVLEELLSLELYHIREERLYRAEVAGMGWALMQLEKLKFFESEDLDAILMVIDRAVFYETDRLSKTGTSTDMVTLAITGLYLYERISRVHTDDRQYWELKESLLIAFFELEHLLKQGGIPEYRFTAEALCRIVLETAMGSSDVGHFCKKGLASLDNTSDFRNTEKGFSKQEQVDREICWTLLSNSKKPIQLETQQKSMERELYNGMDRDHTSRLFYRWLAHSYFLTESLPPMLKKIVTLYLLDNVYQNQFP